MKYFILLLSLSFSFLSCINNNEREMYKNVNNSKFAKKSNEEIKIQNQQKKPKSVFENSLFDDDDDPIYKFVDLNNFNPVINNSELESDNN